MSLPRNADSAARRVDDQDDASAARSGRFKVRIDAFGRIVPEVQPVAGEEGEPEDRRGETP
jgi:hypothetical protein